MPPEVEPADAPKNIRTKNKIVINSVQPVKSTVVKPVVVRIETTLNRADLNVSSAYELSMKYKVTNTIVVNTTIKEV